MTSWLLPSGAVAAVGNKNKIYDVIIACRHDEIFDVISRSYHVTITSSLLPAIGLTDLTGSGMSLLCDLRTS